MSAASTPRTDNIDWSRFDAMSAADRRAAAKGDRDAQPLEAEDTARLKRTPRLKMLRRACGCSQAEFSRIFRIPEALIDELENGRVEPDEAMQAYMQVIAAAPEVVARAVGMHEAEPEQQRYPTGPGSEYDSRRRQAGGLLGR